MITEQIWRAALAIAVIGGCVALAAHVFDLGQPTSTIGSLLYGTALIVVVTGMWADSSPPPPTQPPENREKEKGNR